MTGRNDPCPCGSGKKYKKCCYHTVSSVVNQQPANNLDTAIAYFEADNFPAAINSSEAFLRSYPNEPVAWQIAGISHYYLGEFSAAEKAFTRLVKLDKHNAEALNNLGLVQYEQGKHDAALECCLKAIKLQPEMASAHNNLGNINLAKNNLAEAEANYNKAIGLGLMTAQVYCNLGSVLQRTGKLDEAAEIYQKALKADPEFAPAYNNLGTLLQLKGDMDAALENLQKALKLTPGDPEVIKNIGVYWQLSGDWEQAKQNFEKLLEEDRDNLDALLNIGTLYEEMGRVADAFDIYQKAIKLNPANANANYCLGSEYFRQNNYAKAKGYIKKAMDINPYHAGALAVMGNILLYQSYLVGAEQCFQRALKYAPDDVNVAMYYASFLIKQQRLDDAWTILETFSERFPKSQLIRTGLIEYYRESGMYDKAEEIFQMMSQAEPDNAFILGQWAEMEEFRNQLDRSIDLVKGALKLDESYIGIRIVLIKALIRQKKYQLALDELDKMKPLLNQQNDVGKMDEILYFFERARVLDATQQYDEAYECLVKGNELKNIALGKTYEKDVAQEKYARSRRVFNADFVKSMPRCDTGNLVNQPQPIFIVGFPRSGTTLLERILASHSRVSAGGELPFITEAQDTLLAESDNQDKFPEILLNSDKINSESLQRARQHYLERVKEIGVLQPGRDIFTDKLPQNLIQLGLINILFPDAPVIHITRHPMDSCLSAYMANFAQGHRYTSSMVDTATHYAAMMDLAEHFKSVLDMKYLQIRYEDLVQQPEENVRRVLEFVGLPWEDACLAFYKGKQVAKTASYAQVTQKLYTSSRYRYKNYYSHLAPLEPILRDAMVRFGYTFEP